jgi:hypothetical protein
MAWEKISFVIRSAGSSELNFWSKLGLIVPLAYSNFELVVKESGAASGLFGGTPRSKHPAPSVCS